MRKRVGKLVHWLNSDYEDIMAWSVSRQVSYELLNLFGTTEQSEVEFLEEMWPRLTYSNTERKDIFLAYNWLLDLISNVGVIIVGTEAPGYWSDSLDAYLKEWDEHHREEIREWKQQPRQIVVDAFREYAEIIQRKPNAISELLLKI